jgi:uncharacterized protein YbjT (DUF2867 family)
VAAGIEPVMGDLDDPASLQPALRGVGRAYLVCTPDEGLRAREQTFVRACASAGVGRIVKCSAFAADADGPTQTLRNHAAVEAELAGSGLEYTIVRPHGFMQTFTLLGWPMIEKAGILSLPAGDGGIPLVDVRDVAEIAFRALVEDGHDRRTYDVTGPEILDMHMQAEILGRALGRRIQYLPSQEWQLAMFMRLLGVAPVAAEHALVVFRLQRQRHWERHTDTLRELGITPTRYEQFVDDLLAGRTGGGSSFEPPRALLSGLLQRIMPYVIKFIN